MGEPIRIRTDVVLAVHRRQIAEHGGEEGVRDMGLLESALARPLNVYVYEDAPDLARLAACYAFGIARNHPFVDGNKRAAWVIARTFLRLNGHDLQASAAEVYPCVMQLAAGALAEAELAEWMRERICAR